jgi:hypothetical protein
MVGLASLLLMLEADSIPQPSFLFDTSAGPGWTVFARRTKLRRVVRPDPVYGDWVSEIWIDMPLRASMAPASTRELVVGGLSSGEPPL